MIIIDDVKKNVVLGNQQGRMEQNEVEKAYSSLFDVHFKNRGQKTKNEC